MLTILKCNSGSIIFFFLPGLAICTLTRTHTAAAQVFSQACWLRHVAFFCVSSDTVINVTKIRIGMNKRLTSQNYTLLTRSSQDAVFSPFKTQTLLCFSTFQSPFPQTSLTRTQSQLPSQAPHRGPPREFHTARSVPAPASTSQHRGRRLLYFTNSQGGRQLSGRQPGPGGLPLGSLWAEGTRPLTAAGDALAARAGLRASSPVPPGGGREEARGAWGRG